MVGTNRTHDRVVIEVAMASTNSAPATPDEYIEGIQPESRRSDIRRLHELIRRVAPDLEPRAESDGLAYGSYVYRYASGRDAEWPPIGLASRKQYISLYFMATVGDRYLAETYVERLPKADIGRSCVRFRHLTDVDEGILEQLVREGATAEEHRHIR